MQLPSQLAFAALLFSWLGAPEVAAAKAPNIVVILTDDQGYADISLNPHHPQEVATPNMDALAVDGVVFSQAYTSGCVCSPTRAGLMLGRYQQRVGVYSAGDGGRGFDPKLPIFPAFLPDEYVSTAIGKWHLGLDDDYPELKWHALNRGFDECYMFMGRGGHDYFRLRGVSGEEYLPIYRNKVRLKEGEYEGYLTTRLTEEAVAFIDRQKANPFFLYLAYNAVHAPPQAPQEDIDRFQRNFSGLSKKRAILMAMLYHLDLGVGAVVKKLKEEGLWENTLLFFLTDNGGSAAMEADNGVLRGFKGSLYEGGVRTPWIVSWPARFQGGRTIEAPVISLDILPTALDAIGVEPPTQTPFDGKSLLPLLTSQSTTHHDTLFWSEGGDGEWAVRRGDWKLHGLKDEVELFQLADDPSEKTNLADAKPEVAKTLADAFDAWIAPMADPITGGSKRWAQGPTEESRPERDRVRLQKRTERQERRTASKKAKRPSADLTGPADRPNFILFLIDDQDKASIGAFGGDTYTPNLDRMAADGMKFTHAYVSSAVCTPSRYSFATGRFAGNSTSKLYDEACGGPGRQGHPNFNMALERDRMNIGNVLREAGYVTGWVGKFHLDSEADFPEFYKGDDGFREIPKKGLAAGAEASELFAHNERVMRRYIQNLGFSWASHVYAGNLQAPYNHHNPEWTTAAALEFIEENKDRPFYLHYCTTLLHGGEGSWRASMDFPLDSGAGALASLPDVMTPRRELLKSLAQKGFDPDSPTAGEAWIDDAVGAILKKLKELGIDDNTLVLFAPDHGRRGKGSLFTQDGVCVPMIARWPRRIPAGAACDELVENVDWAPTVFDAAGVAKPEGYRVDGRSFLPLLRGDPGARGRDHVYLEMGFARGVATGRWKYIAVRYPQEQIEIIKNSSLERLPRAMSYIGRLGIGTRGAEWPGFWDGDQLYDLEADPGELNNLAANPRYAAPLDKMRQLLREDLLASGRPFGEFAPGGNAAPGGQIDDQIAKVKTLTINGKTVIIPRETEPARPR